MTDPTAPREGNDSVEHVDFGTAEAAQQGDGFEVSRDGEIIESVPGASHDEASTQSSGSETTAADDVPSYAPSEHDGPAAFDAPPAPASAVSGPAASAPAGSESAASAPAASSPTTGAAGFGAPAAPGQSQPFSTPAPGTDAPNDGSQQASAPFGAPHGEQSSGQPGFGAAQGGAGYGASYGGQPNYGAPQGAQPGYGAPQGGQPGYGAPQYGQPGSGAPQYGAPGQPQYGAPGQPHYAQGAPMSPMEEKNAGMWAHLSGLSTFITAGWGGWIGPLIVFLMYKDRSAFVRQESKEALNFGILTTICTVGLIVVGTVLSIVGIGFIFLMFYWVPALLQIIFSIMGAVRVNAGGSYRYPFNWRLVK